MLNILKSSYFAATKAPATKAELLALFFLVVLLIVIVIIYFIGLWKVFEKAGRKGWLVFIPVYDLWVESEIGDNPGWWALLLIAANSLGNNFIKHSKHNPSLVVFGVISYLIYVVIYVLIIAGIGKNFGKGFWFKVLLVFLPFIGFPILGFGTAKYKKVKK